MPREVLYQLNVSNFLIWFLYPMTSQGSKSSEMNWKTVEKCSLLRRVQIAVHLRWPSRLLPTKSVKKSVMVWGCISAHGMGDLHTCVTVPLMLRLMLEFWRDICCRQDDDFSQELHVYFSRTMPGLILYKLQQQGFVGIESVCLTGLPAVQIGLLLKMFGTSWRGESDNGDHSLYTPTVGKNSTCKIATIDIFSSQTITKCN